MAYQMFKGDNEASIFLIRCGSDEGVKKAVDHYKSLGYDCDIVLSNPSITHVVIVRPFDRVLLPSGPSMCYTLKNQKVPFYTLEEVEKNW
ncbi:MAG: hypothetical protein LKJ88_08295 [Bacilli bacterium]|jgi:hypothetical protein|nr:hypothetical protein [Bacilli bacterium]